MDIPCLSLERVYAFSQRCSPSMWVGRFSEIRHLSKSLDKKYSTGDITAVSLFRFLYHTSPSNPTNEVS